MAEIDLDALRAARSETTQEPHTLKFKGETFELPAVVGADLLVALSSRTNGKANPDWDGIVTSLFDGARDRFLALKPDKDDLNDILMQVGAIYAGTSLGE